MQAAATTIARLVNTTAIEPKDQRRDVSPTDRPDVRCECSKIAPRHEPPAQRRCAPVILDTALDWIAMVMGSGANDHALRGFPTGTFYCCFGAHLWIARASHPERTSVPVHAIGGMGW